MQQKVQVVSSRSRQMNSQLQQFGSQTRSAPMMTFNSLSKSSLPPLNSKSNDVVDPFRERQDCSSDGQQEQGKESQESSTNDTDVVAAMPV